MIRQRKVPEPPASLEKTGRYDGEDVKKQLLQDQDEKCYLCERHLETDFEIEHLKSRSNFPQSAKDWKNLFLVCGYCNRKKSDNFDDISSPLDNALEEDIEQTLNGDGGEKAAVFSNRKGDKATARTIELLNIIYNGQRRCRTKKEERFIDAILAYVNDFRKLINNYLNQPTEENITAIQAELGIDRVALGFKYWIIQANPRLKAQFSHCLRWNNGPSEMDCLP